MARVREESNRDRQKRVRIGSKRILDESDKGESYLVCKAVNLELCCRFLIGAFFMYNF